MRNITDNVFSAVILASSIAGSTQTDIHELAFGETGPPLGRLAVVGVVHPLDQTLSALLSQL